MLSIMNEIDLSLLLLLCVLYEIQNQIFQQLVSDSGFLFMLSELMSEFYTMEDILKAKARINMI